MFARKAQLKTKVWMALVVLFMTAFFGIHLVIGMGQDAGLTFEQGEVEALMKVLFPFGAMAFGIVFAQYLPIWEQPKS